MYKNFYQVRHPKATYQRVHETPTFKCGTCGKLFIRSGILKRHEKSVHGGKNIFTCSTCDKYYGRKDSLKKHISSVHEGQNIFKFSTTN